jgi:hypothetical protein
MLSSHQTRSTLPRSTLGHDSLPLGESDRKVIRFPHRGVLRREPTPAIWDTGVDSPVEGLERYERGPESEEEYRCRMMGNLLAAIVVILLIVTGSWILETMISTTQNGHDCYRSGARNCASSYVPQRDTSL